uniref:fibronectin type III domain-containing protein 7-like n=1 Tax=Monopterus albus TaxID=43700 RepID=UPI0009B31DA9|nr:fibronectin type III domain-containing protein 7-like [Monopterus albus]XP_020471690.1 fibronectin type III domain-containing protein 7-like [Monopterus albus]
MYQVKLKVLQFYTIICTDNKTAMTVPVAPTFTVAKALSSSSIRLEWSSVVGTDNYTLFVDNYNNPAIKYSLTVTNLSAQIYNLSSSTIYNCYLYSSNIGGYSAKSSVKTVLTLIQPPTGMTAVKTGNGTAKIMWNPVSKVLRYRVTVCNNDNPSETPFNTTVSTTSLNISVLDHCATYTVGVSSLNAFLDPGEPFNITYSNSFIKPVTTISVDYSCSSATVTLTWDLVLGASLYQAMAVDSTGIPLSCTTASSSCQISMLKCGENYQVYITAIDEDCGSTANSSTFFHTVPCAPANPQISHQCSSNVVIFGWQPTNNTAYYVAMGVDKNGQATECMTEENSCYFTNTECGSGYTYTVYAVSSTQCNSGVTQPVTVWTAPCPSLNLQVATECISDQLITTWDLALGALSYTVEAVGMTGETYNCTSPSTSCVIPNVPCGEYLSLSLVASNDNCSISEVMVVTTVPCAPTDVSAYVDCNNNNYASVNWTDGYGAIFYTAVAHDEDGNLYSCNSMGSACIIEGLRGGQTYLANVISTNIMCNSTVSEEVIVVPCDQQNITSNLTCGSNILTVSWISSAVALNYHVTAVPLAGNMGSLTCESNSTNCSLSGLQCGQTYNVSYIACSENCSGPSTPLQTVQAGPCAPTNVSSQLNCSADIAQVSWTPSVNAVSYAVTATSNGQSLTCTSSSSNCTLSNLVCGQTYNISVTATDGNCVSNYSDPFTQNQVPCAPQNISSNLTCGSNILTVSWISSAVALNYHVTAVPLAGNTSSLSCQTNSSSCSVSGLQCGQTYNVSVKACSAGCSGVSSTPQTVQTGPCQPGGLSVSFFCKNQSALLSWNASYIGNYYGCAMDGNGDMLCCHTTNPTCIIQGLNCGTVYNFIVQSSDGTHNSSYSDVVQKGAVPCPPDAVDVHLLPMQTENQVLRFNWTAVPCNNTEYLVTLTGNVLGDSQALIQVSSYWTTMSYFEIPLPCSSSYVATMQSKNAAGISDPSVPIIGTTAPCPPSLVIYNGSAVSWNASVFATMYTVYDNSVRPMAQLCSTTGLSCSLSNVNSTNLVVTASNSFGESNTQNVVKQGRRRRDLGGQMPMSGLSASVLDVKQQMSTVISEWSQVDTASRYSLFIKKQGSSSNHHENTPVDKAGGPHASLD